jgi:hypothetical protein
VPTSGFRSQIAVDLRCFRRPLVCVFSGRFALFRGPTAAQARRRTLRIHSVSPNVWSRSQPCIRCDGPSLIAAEIKTLASSTPASKSLRNSRSGGGAAHD